MSNPAAQTNKSALSILYVYIPIILFCFIPVWIFFIGPIIKKLPENFNYSADILSLDNFYNEKLKRFEGEHISKTIFTYRVINQNKQFLVVLNTFEVRSLDNTAIFMAKREYTINPFTWQHVPTTLKNRRGYLFGPRYATTNNFIYWHINYDAPATMVFQDKEFINGLLVYRYEANFSADQSKELAYLPALSIDRGIITHIKLQLWIEPISGWLIKYQDNSIAYYFDKKSGQILFPWNQFSNRYTLNSIDDQVENAFKQKWMILIVDIIVPGFLLVLGSGMIVMGLLKTNHISKSKIFRSNPLSDIRYIGLELGLLAVLGALLTTHFFITLNAKKENYKIGIALWDLRSNKQYVNGFKDGLKQRGYVEGKNLQLITQNANANIENQIGIVQSYVRQKVDLVYTLTTPGTLIAKGVTNDIPIVFANVTYPAQTGIIASNEDSKNNLVGVRNYVSAAKQFYELEKLFPNIKKLGFVHRKRDPDSNFQFNEFKSTLANRNVDVIELAALDAEDLDQILAQNPQVDALFLACDTLAQEGVDKMLAKYSQQKKIPSISCHPESVANGMLLGYSPDPYLMGQRAGIKAALILQGADPSWLETTSIQKGLLNINTTTANTIGLQIPPQIKQEAVLFK